MLKLFDNNGFLYSQYVVYFVQGTFKSTDDVYGFVYSKEGHRLPFWLPKDYLIGKVVVYV